MCLRELMKYINMIRGVYIYTIYWMRINMKPSQYAAVISPQLFTFNRHQIVGIFWTTIHSTANRSTQHRFIFDLAILDRGTLWRTSPEFSCICVSFCRLCLCKNQQNGAHIMGRVTYQVTQSFWITGNHTNITTRSIFVIGWWMAAFFLKEPISRQPLCGC